MTRRANIDLGSPTLNEAFEAIRADYNASKKGRFQRTRSGVGATGQHADYHFRSESQFYYAMELARDIMRNDVIVGQGVRRFVNNVVQDGFNVDPSTGDTGIDADLYDRWWDWAEDPDQCDLAGEHNFHSLEKLTLQQVIVDGDVCTLPNIDGPLETLEAHRLKTPTGTKRNVVYGVLLDDNRKRIEYWFSREDVGTTGIVSRVGDTRAIPTRDSDGNRQVFHLYRPDRVSQTRGFTAFAPITDTCGMHDDVQFAQLVKAQVAGCFAILEEVPIAAPPGRPTRAGSRDEEALSDGTSRNIEGIAPGMRIRSAPGSKMTGFSPNIPNPEFFPHSMLILTFIAVNLGMPVQLLLLDPKQTNFSGWRGAIDQARMGFRDVQQWLIGALHRPVYRWKVRQWMAEDAALRSAASRQGIDIFCHQWNPPRWPYIEPLADSQARLVRVRTLQISPRRGAAEDGNEWSAIVRETIEDNASAIVAAKQKADEINKQFPSEGDAVTWHDLLSLPTADRMQYQYSETQLRQPAGRPDETPDDGDDGGKQK